MNYKYLLDNIDLSLCLKSCGVVFCHLFEILQELPPDKMKWCNGLLLDANKRSLMHSDCSTCTVLPKVRTTADVMVRCNTITNLYHNLDFNLKFDELLESRISESIHVTSLLMALEAVCAWNYHHHYIVGEKTVVDADLVKLRLKLDSRLITRRGWSPLPREFQSHCLRLYTKKCNRSSSIALPMNSNWIAPQDSSEFVVLKCVETFKDPFRPLSRSSRLIFHFKHPSISSCNLLGDCGFVLKTVQSAAALWKLELCTEDKEYCDEFVHFHEEIRAEKMHILFMRRAFNKFMMFPLTWLNHVSSSQERDRWSNQLSFDYGGKFEVVYCLN